MVLAGGRNSRMGGLDKGLLLFEGLPLASRTAKLLDVTPTILDYFGVGTPDLVPSLEGRSLLPRLGGPTTTTTSSTVPMTVTTLAAAAASSTTTTTTQP